MYRRYVAELKLANGEQSNNASHGVLSDDTKIVEERQKPATQNAGQRIPLPVCKSRSGTLLPPASSPSSAAIIGNFSRELSPFSSTFRVYICGLSIEDEVERRALDTALLKIKEYCHGSGCDIETIDLEMYDLDLNIDSDSYFEEIRNCQNKSVGVNIMIFLNSGDPAPSHLPCQIGIKHFQKLCTATSISEEEKVLLTKWYKVDENLLDPTFVLSQADDVIPEGEGATSDKQRVAMAISEAAKEVFHGDEIWEFTNREKYAVNSRPLVSDGETGGIYWLMKHGVLDIAGRTCLCYKRSTHDGSRADSTESLTSVEPLIRQKIGTVHHYSTKEPSSEEQLLGMIHEHLYQSVQETMANRQQNCSYLDDKLHHECMEHLVVSYEKLKGYQERPEILQSIKDYILGKSQNLFILHGPHGSGKSTIMAAAARKAFDWIEKDAGVILRFVGASSSSSNDLSLLSSIHEQIYRIKNFTIDKPTRRLLSNVENFKETIHTVEQGLKGRLVIFIDGVDQLSRDGDVRHILHWFPELPADKVKVILSMSFEETFLSDTEIKRCFEKHDMLLIPGIGDMESLGMIKAWLADRKRTLNDRQYAIVKQCIKGNQNHPLLLRAIASCVHKWTSGQKEEDLLLENDMAKLMKNFLDGLDRRHGKTFVSRTFSYITAAVGGLTESELSDILSCDQEVKDSLVLKTFIYRLVADSSTFICRRMIQGETFITWSHSIFENLAKNRYMADDDSCKEIHRAFAGYVRRTWKEGKYKHSDFHIKRRIGNLAYHYINAGMIKELKSHCLMNVEYLYFKCENNQVRGLIKDYEQAKLCFPKDQDISQMSNHITLCSDVLVNDPHQLLSQLLDRFSQIDCAKDMLEGLRRLSQPLLEVSPPILVSSGQRLIHSIKMEGTVQKLSVSRTADGVQALCGLLNSNLVKHVNITDGRVIRNMYLYNDCKGIDEESLLTFALGGSMGVACVKGNVYGFDMEGDERFYIHQGQSKQVCYCGKNNDKIVNFGLDDYISVISSHDGSEIYSLPPQIKFGPEPFQSDLCRHSEHYIIGLDTYRFVLFDVAERTFSKVVEICWDNSIGKIVISPDEKMIALMSMSAYKKRELFTYDVKMMEKTKSITVNTSYSNSLTISNDNRHVMYVASYGRVVSVNIVTEDVQIIHRDSSSIQCMEQIDENTWVTGAGNILNVWKADREATPTTMSNTAIFRYKLNDIFPLENTRYVLLVSHKCEDDGLCIQIYDLLTRKVVRQTTKETEELIDFTVINDTNMVLLFANGEMVKVCLNTMTVSLVYKTNNQENSFTGYYGWPESLYLKFSMIESVSGGKEILTSSFSKDSLLLYDNDSGEVVGCLSLPEELRHRDMELELFMVDREKNICILCDDYIKPVLIVFSITDRQYLLTVSPEELGPDYRVISVSNGGYMGILTRDHQQKKKAKYTWVSLLYNITQNAGQIEKVYADIDYEQYKKSQPKWSPLPRSSEVTSALIVDQQYFVTASCDGLIRIWDMETDELDRKAAYKADDDDNDIKLSYAGEGPLVVSFDGETFQVWHKGSWESLGSFTVDHDISEWSILRDGKSFIGITHLGEVHHFTVRGAGIHGDLSQQTELFPGEDVDNELDFSTTKYGSEESIEDDSD